MMPPFGPREVNGSEHRRQDIEKTEGLGVFNKGRARAGCVLVLHTLREKSQIQEDKYHMLQLE